MELTKIWTENKKAIVTTVACVLAGLLAIRFFDVIFWTAFVVVIAVTAVLGWNHLVKKHGGAEGVWKSLLAELGIK